MILGGDACPGAKAARLYSWAASRQGMVRLVTVFHGKLQTVTYALDRGFLAVVFGIPFMLDSLRELALAAAIVFVLSFWVIDRQVLQGILESLRAW